jgi:hypothetical protein
MKVAFGGDFTVQSREVHRGRGGSFKSELPDPRIHPPTHPIGVNGSHPALTLVVAAFPRANASSRMYCPSCVVFPLPVSPHTTVTRADAPSPGVRVQGYGYLSCRTRHALRLALDARAKQGRGGAEERSRLLSGSKEAAGTSAVACHRTYRSIDGPFNGPFNGASCRRCIFNSSHLLAGHPTEIFNAADLAW